MSSTGVSCTVKNEQQYFEYFTEKVEVNNYYWKMILRKQTFEVESLLLCTNSIGI